MLPACKVLAVLTAKSTSAGHAATIAAGGINAVVTALRTRGITADVAENALWILSNLSNAAGASASIVKAGGLEAIAVAMAAHPTKVQVNRVGKQALASIERRSGAAATSTGGAGAAAAAGST